MDVSDLAVDAAGDSVTPERLTDDVVDALGADEQPQHLLLGQSLDVTTEGDRDRVFPGLDDAVSLVATDRRVVVVVPRAVGRRVERLDYDAVTDVTADTGRFKRLDIETAAGSVGVNLPDDERPAPVAAFVRDRASGGAEERSDTTATVEGGTSATAQPTTDDAAASETDDTVSAPDGADSSTTRDPAGHSEPGDVVTDDAAVDGDSPDGDGTTGGDGSAEDGDPLDRLERLAELRDQGIVTDEEFEARKQDLLDRI